MLSAAQHMKTIKKYIQIIQFILALIALGTTLMGLLKKFMDWSERFDYEK